MMAYYKVRIEVWCDWDPAESDLEEIAENISAGEAICTKRKILKVVDRPQDIEDEEAMSFFGGEEGRRRSKPGVGGAGLTAGPYGGLSTDSESGQDEHPLRARLEHPL